MRSTMRPSHFARPTRTTCAPSTRSPTSSKPNAVSTGRPGAAQQPARSRCAHGQARRCAAFPWKAAMKAAPASRARARPRRLQSSPGPIEMIEQDPLDGVETALRTGLELDDAQFQALASLDGGATERFRGIWNELSAEQRAKLLQQLGEAAEENLVLDFMPIYVLAVEDPDPGVRELGFLLAGR